MTETDPSTPISEIYVSGFKSVAKAQSIGVGPLTILAGANSSGKSSVMQAILLLKQTVDAPYDPGALRLDGPNVRFTSAEQLLSRTKEPRQNRSFSVGMKLGTTLFRTITFKQHAKQGFRIDKMVMSEPTSPNGKMVLREGMSSEAIEAVASPELKEFRKHIFGVNGKWCVTRNRCFLELGLGETGPKPMGQIVHQWDRTGAAYVRDLIHVPGLRGNPSRTYPVTAVGSAFPGTFETYTASIIAKWQLDRQEGKLTALSHDLEELGLTWKVEAKRVDDTQVELQVGRLPHVQRGKSQDLVNIADVGFGVSQTLPILVALHVAKRAQLIYVEQPEIHLHPWAQTRLAHVIAAAIKRGVRVVVETHSALLLLAFQALVAEGKLPAKDVQLHWFKRSSDGNTQITAAQMDGNGAFGSWPEDFSNVLLKTQDEYLTAIERREAGMRAGK